MSKTLVIKTSDFEKLVEDASLDKYPRYFGNGLYLIRPNLICGEEFYKKYCEKIQEIMNELK